MSYRQAIAEKLLEKELADVNQSISNLTENGLLSNDWTKWEIELIFDASLAFERLDSLLDSQTPLQLTPNPQKSIEGSGWDFSAGVGLY